MDFYVLKGMWLEIVECEGLIFIISCKVFGLDLRF